MNTPRATPHLTPCEKPRSVNTQHQSKDSPHSARIVERAGRPVPLAAAKEERPAKKGFKLMLKCECQHAKSIHSRMYANPKLGTSCNFPGCRCKAYRPAPKQKTKSRR